MSKQSSNFVHSLERIQNIWIAECLKLNDKKSIITYVINNIAPYKTKQKWQVLLYCSKTGCSTCYWVTTIVLMVFKEKNDNFSQFICQY